MYVLRIRIEAKKRQLFLEAPSYDYSVYILFAKFTYVSTFMVRVSEKYI